MADNSLITKYRPTDFSEVHGHKEILKSLQNVLNKGLSKSFVFVGPPGIGKTTLARILAKEVHCRNITEIDGATFTGIESIRELTSTLGYKPLVGETKVIIVDECHRLSTAAITSLLKVIEEPQDHVYWCLCTTEIEKIPKAILTRCQVYQLKPLNDGEICDLLMKVCTSEKFDTSDEVLELIIDNSNGSARQALAFLAACSECKTKEEALPLLNSAVESETMIGLARHLLKEKQLTWNGIKPFLVSLKSENNESTRITIVNYISAVIVNTNDQREVARLLNIVSAFKGPYIQSEKIAPILLALGELIFD